MLIDLLSVENQTSLKPIFSFLALLPIWGFELLAGTGFMGPIWGKNRIFRAQILNNFEAVFILNISIFEKKFSQFFQNKKNLPRRTPHTKNMRMLGRRHTHELWAPYWEQG